MKYYCIEHNECGFFKQTTNTKQFEELICPNCYSPMLVYHNQDTPDWINSKKDNQRSDER